MLLLLMLLIVLVATFNIISSLFMVVSEKKSDIAILKTIGMNSRNIMKIFILQGFLVSGILLIYDPSNEKGFCNGKNHIFFFLISTI